MKMLVNFILFQFGWFTCVISAGNNLEALAIISLVVIIIIHLSLDKQRWHSELLFISITGFIGLTIDSLLISLNVFAANSEVTFHGIAPPWLVGMWMLFGMTINHSMSWLKNKLLLASFLGGVFAPLAYWAGVRLSALENTVEYNDYLAFLIIGMCWFFVMPTLFWVSAFINRKFGTYPLQNNIQNSINNS